MLSFYSYGEYSNIMIDCINFCFIEDIFNFLIFHSLYMGSQIIRRFGTIGIDYCNSINNMLKQRNDNNNYINF